MNRFDRERQQREPEPTSGTPSETWSLSSPQETPESALLQGMCGHASEIIRIIGQELRGTLELPDSTLELSKDARAVIATLNDLVEEYDALLRKKQIEESKTRLAAIRQELDRIVASEGKIQTSYKEKAERVLGATCLQCPLNPYRMGTTGEYIVSQERWNEVKPCARIEGVTCLAKAIDEAEEEDRNPDPTECSGRVLDGEDMAYLVSPRIAKKIIDPKFIGSLRRQVECSLPGEHLLEVDLKDYAKALCTLRVSDQDSFTMPIFLEGGKWKIFSLGKRARKKEGADGYRISSQRMTPEGFPGALRRGNIDVDYLADLGAGRKSHRKKAERYSKALRDIGLVVGVEELPSRLARIAFADGLRGIMKCSGDLDTAIRRAKS